MNERIEKLAAECETTYIDRDGREYVEFDKEKFAMLVVQQYENDKRESRRDTMSELGYSRIGRGNI